MVYFCREEIRMESSVARNFPRTSQALADKMSGKLHDMQRDARPSMRAKAARLREIVMGTSKSIQGYTKSVTGYTKQKPLTALTIAAASGAALFVAYQALKSARR
jgi:hypothetical protein